jgi:hypothetical protein
MRHIDITVDRYGNGYAACTDGLEQPPLPGTSPDEALGHAISALWLAGVLDKPIKLNLQMNTV